MSDLFGSQIEQMAQTAAEAEEGVVSAEMTTTEWPDSRNRIEQVVIKTLTTWLTAIRALLQPINLRWLHWERFKVTLWRGFAWFKPLALRTRGRILLYRLRIIGRWLWMRRRELLLGLLILAIILTVVWIVLNWNDIITFFRELLGGGT